MIIIIFSFYTAQITIKFLSAMEIEENQDFDKMTYCLI